VKLGDVVFFKGERWKVTNHRQEYRVCELTNWAMQKEEVEDTLDQDLGALNVLFNPTKDWPFVSVKLRSEAAGPVRKVLRAGAELKPLEDWVPGDMWRPGGALFFNPDLKLRMGEVLVAIHRGGNRSRVSLNTTFGTIATRKARAAAPPRKPKGPATRFDRILGADPFEDDE
jgi:hypothetical protein